MLITKNRCITFFLLESRKWDFWMDQGVYALENLHILGTVSRHGCFWRSWLRQNRLNHVRPLISNLIAFKKQLTKTGKLREAPSPDWITQDKYLTHRAYIYLLNFPGSLMSSLYIWPSNISHIDFSPHSNLDILIYIRIIGAIPVGRISSGTCFGHCMGYSDADVQLIEPLGSAASWTSHEKHAFRGNSIGAGRLLIWQFLLIASKSN